MKEFAWWLRDRRFSNVNDALGHQILVRNLIYIAHALTMERKFSFRYLDAYFLEKFIEKAALGLDAVIDASRRVEVFAASVDHECIERIAGMRIHRNRVIAAKRVAEACNLPGGTLALPRVADAIGRLAISVGLKPPRKAGGNAEPLRTLTVAALGRWLTPLEHLYAMRDVMEAQSLKERPFPEGAHSLAADLGAETESTPTVPPFLAIKLMEYSARTVLEASELEVGGAISSATVVDLLTACWVIVATFTARRAEEIFELSDHSDGDENPGGCLEGNRSNGWYLRIYIAKTHKETTWIPVPELLVRAIEYSALSARKRGLNLVVNSFSDGLTREANHDDSMHRIVLIGLL